jgi:hypothetical protein
MVLVHARDVLTFEPYGPRIGARLAGDDIHQCGFAGAVGSHDAPKLAGL